MSIKNNPIPCLFKYFNEVPEWKEGFAYLSQELYSKGRAYISLTENGEIMYYCFSHEENVPSCSWIHSSPVLKELYEIEDLPWV